jgi:hypothetical protein
MSKSLRVACSASREEAETPLQNRRTSKYKNAAEVNRRG